ncbi:MAG: hypothetical protein KBD37_09765, partial [Burkholderiales bacterium]|nr:hypothetical protein [Burkholderiales bacterium]
IEARIQGKTSLNVAEIRSLEFAKLGYLTQLEAARTLLYGLDTRSRQQPGGAAVIADTVNLMTALTAIEEYINSEDCLRGADHPVSTLDSEIFSLLPKLLSVITDVNNRKNVTSQLRRIRKICQRSNQTDSRLLQKLEAFNPENSAWFQEALHTYEIIANNLDLKTSSHLLYNPIQMNLAKQVGFGLIDGLLLGYALLSSVVQTAIQTGGSAWIGLSTVGTTVADAASSVFNCLTSSNTNPTATFDEATIQQLTAPAILDANIKVNGTYLQNRTAQLTAPDYIDIFDSYDFQ